MVEPRKEQPGGPPPRHQDRMVGHPRNEVEAIGGDTVQAVSGAHKKPDILIIHLGGNYPTHTVGEDGSPT